MSRPDRIVDAHVHLWDPARSDWYPYLSGRQDIGMETRGMARQFGADTYAAEAAGWNVTALVNVAAATGRHSIDETLKLDSLADDLGEPSAIVGGLPPTASIDEAIALIDRQMTAARFRGVRPMGAGPGPLPQPEVLVALAQRELVFDLMAHPDQLLSAAAGLETIEHLAVVVEHTGWPRSDTDEEFDLWQKGMRALASLGPRVTCKVSGLAMPLGSMDPNVFGRWTTFAIETFGPERCMFASNFPVDGMHGTLDQLWTTYATLASGLTAHDRDHLFALTAERVYRI